LANRVCRAFQRIRERLSNGISKIQVIGINRILLVIVIDSWSGRSARLGIRRQVWFVWEVSKVYKTDSQPRSTRPLISVRHIKAVLMNPIQGRTCASIAAAKRLTTKGAALGVEI